MNDRLEAFRKRLRGPDKQTNWQFWIGSPTAWLALVISTTTAFFSLFYHSDELSVAVTPSVVVAGLVATPNGVVADRTAPRISVQAPGTITLINSGSRPIAVLRIVLRVMQPVEEEDERLECSPPRGMETEMRVSFEQTVIKPYEALTRELKFVELDQVSSRDWFYTQASEVNLKRQNQELPRSYTPNAVTCCPASSLSP